MLPITPQFYVYVLFHETGEPFYVGKGTNGRWLRHEFDARNGAKGHRFSIIRAMQARGLEIPKVKLRDGLTEALAHEHEVALIAAIGRRHEGGPLVNSTAGGEGGSDPSPETRAKKSVATRGRPKPPEHIAKVANANRGKKRSPKFRAECALRRQGQLLADEARAKIGAFWRGKKRSAENRANISAGKRGKRFSDAHRASLRAAWIRRRAHQTGDAE
jgi:hypothetical protein